MKIKVIHIPAQYTLEGDWFCDHLGEPEIQTITVDSLNWAGEHTTYQKEIEVCASCGEEIE